MYNLDLCCYTQDEGWGGRLLLLLSDSGTPEAPAMSPSPQCVNSMLIVLAVNRCTSLECSVLTVGYCQHHVLLAAEDEDMMAVACAVSPQPLAAASLDASTGYKTCARAKRAETNVGDGKQTARPHQRA